MADGVLEINDENFETEVLNADGPVLVDFWAPWCGPCKAIGPIIEDLSTSFNGKIKFTKCNVDDNPASPGKYGVRSIPTLIFFKNGAVAEQVVGLVAKTKLEDIINNII